MKELFGSYGGIFLIFCKKYRHNLHLTKTIAKQKIDFEKGFCVLFKQLASKNHI